MAVKKIKREAIRRIVESSEHPGGVQIKEELKQEEMQ